MIAIFTVWINIVEESCFSLRHIPYYSQHSFSHHNDINALDYLRKEILNTKRRIESD